MPGDVSPPCNVDAVKSRSGGSRDVIETSYVKKSHACGTCDAATVAAGYAVDISEVGERSVVLPAMVRKCKRAGKRRFSAKHLRQSRGVYNCRPVSQAVMIAMLALVQCVNVVAEVPLLGKSSMQRGTVI